MVVIFLLLIFWDDSNKGCVMKGLVLVFLGKFYLYLEEWGVVVIEFNKLIGGDYGIFDLM